MPPTVADKPFPWKEVLVNTTGGPDGTKAYRYASWKEYDLFVRFTDSAGRRWVRSPDGTLKQTVDYATEQAAEMAEFERLNPGVLKAGGVKPEVIKAALARTKKTRWWRF